MKAMYRMHTMNMFADAYAAPACQSATMAMTSTRRVRILDTAVLAVSFLFGILLGIVTKIVRIIGSTTAKP